MSGTITSSLSLTRNAVRCLCKWARSGLMSVVHVDRRRADGLGIADILVPLRH